MEDLPILCIENKLKSDDFAISCKVSKSPVGLGYSEKPNSWNDDFKHTSHCSLPNFSTMMNNHKLTPESQTEDGRLGTWGWPLTKVARTPQKPALTMTQPRPWPATPSPSPSTHHTKPRVQWKIRMIIMILIIKRGERRGKTLKLSNTEQDTPNTMHYKTTSTCH